MDIVEESTLDRYFWARHANPKSGWSRVASMPLLMTCLYRRDWRGLVLTLLLVALNPVLFSPPADDSAWMTKVVYGERLWSRQEHSHTSYPGILNVCNGLATVYAIYAAVKQRPAETTLATALSMTLKFWFVAEMAHVYEASRRGEA